MEEKIAVQIESLYLLQDAKEILTEWCSAMGSHNAAKRTALQMRSKGWFERHAYLDQRIAAVAKAIEGTLG